MKDMMEPTKEDECSYPEAFTSHFQRHRSDSGISSLGSWGSELGEENTADIFVQDAVFEQLGRSNSRRRLLTEPPIAILANTSPEIRALCKKPIVVPYRATITNTTNSMVHAARSLNTSIEGVTAERRHPDDGMDFEEYGGAYQFPPECIKISVSTTAEQFSTPTFVVTDEITWSMTSVNLHYCPAGTTAAPQEKKPLDSNEVERPDSRKRKCSAKHRRVNCESLPTPDKIFISGFLPEELHGRCRSLSSGEQLNEPLVKLRRI